jgi:hypothetical protein
LRVGNNTYWFVDGKYDGPEYAIRPETTYTVDGQIFPGEKFSEELLPEMLLNSVEMKGKQPDETYFPEGSKGHNSESR